MTTSKRDDSSPRRGRSKSGSAATPSPARAGSGRQPVVTSAEDRRNLNAQREIFDRAVHYFHKGDFRTAKDLFQQAAAGIDRGMAHSARQHARMCELRIEKAGPVLATAEDYYNYAVSLMNRGELARAEEQFQKALAMDQSGDHIYYALALCQGLAGNLEAASRNLRRAIELQPRNLLAARSDPDFAPIAAKPPLRQLLFP